MQEAKKLGYLDGLKVIACFMVFNFHFVNLFYPGEYCLLPEYALILRFCSLKRQDSLCAQNSSNHRRLKILQEPALLCLLPDIHERRFL